MNRGQRDLTQGNVFKQLLMFSLPFLVSNLLQSLYGMVDMLIVGRYLGDSGIASVNVSTQVMMIMVSLIIGITTGATVLASQYKGAQEMDFVQKTVATIFTVSIYIGIALTLLSLFIAKPLLRAVNTPPEAFDGAVAYLRICGLGILFMFGFNGISAILRGLGDSKRPLYFMIASTVTNVALDILFVGPLGLGAGGAALATVLAQGLAFALSVYYLVKTNFLFDFKPKSFVINKPILKKMLIIGIPSSVQMTVMSGSFLFISKLVNDFGLAAASASGIGAKIDGFAVLPALAISSSVSAMVGQNIGAKKIERVRQTLFAGIAISFILSLLVFIVVRFHWYTLFMAFSKEPTPKTIEYGYLYIQIVTFSYLIMSCWFPFNGLAIGSGNTMFSLGNAIITALVIRVPLAYFLSRFMGVTGVYWGMAIAPVGGLLVGLVFYFSNIWQRRKIE